MRTGGIRRAASVLSAARAGGMTQRKKSFMVCFSPYLPLFFIDMNDSILDNKNTLC